MKTNQNKNQRSTLSVACKEILSRLALLFESPSQREFRRLKNFIAH
jgi:hypothetical protein